MCVAPQTSPDAKVLEEHLKKLIDEVHSDCLPIIAPPASADPRNEIAGMQIISDPVMGRYCLVLSRDQNCVCVSVPKYRRPVTMFDSNMSLDHKADLVVMGMQPFEPLLVAFFAKYEKKEVKLKVDGMPPPLPRALRQRPSLCPHRCVCAHALVHASCAPVSSAAAGRTGEFGAVLRVSRALL